VQGFRPSVRDDARAWAVERSRLRPDSVVVVGTSRIQAGLHPHAWAENWDGRNPVQLSVVGGSPLPVLQHLAEERSFHGLVLVDALPRILFEATEVRSLESQRTLDAYAEIRASPGEMLESRLRVRAQEALASQSMPLAQFVRRAFLRRDAARLPYFSMSARRFLELDFQRADVDGRIATLLSQISEQGRPAVGDQIDEIIARVGRAADRIGARGGGLVLVHMPHDGSIRDLEEALYPRAEYWDKLAVAIDGVAIHSADHAALSSYRCPDGSHLDVRDAPAFTGALADLIREQLERRRGAAIPGLRSARRSS
jgi:hypothetical protein